MMKRALTIGLASVAIAAALSAVTVSARSPEPLASENALPAKDIETRAIEMGLQPLGQPVRRGPNFVLHVYDRRGREMRLEVDAEFGDILSLSPLDAANAYANVPRYDRKPVVIYDRSPRIIHVPQPGENVNAALPAARSQPAEDVIEAAPPSKPRRVTPAPQKKSNTQKPAVRKPYSTSAPVAPAPADRRTVLTAPIHDGPTPIRPTPRFTQPIGEKSPPPGYTPPTNMPAPETVPPEATAQDVAPSGEHTEIPEETAQ